MPKGISFLFLYHMKYKVEIEGPEGCKPVVDGTTIRFVPCKPDWQEIKTVEQVIDYCEKYFKEESRSLRDRLNYFSSSDYYEYWFSLYRLIVMAITDNEKVDLIKGNLYYPYVQFCREDCIKNCWGDKVVGHITYQGKRYAVVGGNATDGSTAGLGYFNSYSGVSCSDANIGFQSVSSLDKARHISKYFGKVVFYLMYYGTNCDWKWDKDY